MPLSDDDKKLLQQEISILTQDQKDLLSSLKEARMELRTEVAERLAVHQKLVQELEIYKWVIRFLFVILLGGSIYGILSFGSFVDARIADRMKRSDKLSQALSCAQLGQWEPAHVSTQATGGRIRALQQARSSRRSSTSTLRSG